MESVVETLRLVVILQGLMGGKTQIYQGGVCKKISELILSLHIDPTHHEALEHSIMRGTVALDIFPRAASAAG